MYRRPNGGNNPAVAERPLVYPFQARGIVGEYRARDRSKMLTKLPELAVESTSLWQISRALMRVFGHVGLEHIAFAQAAHPFMAAKIYMDGCDGGSFIAFHLTIQNQSVDCGRR